MDGGAGEAEAMELVNTFLLANCCRLLEGSWFLSAAQFSSSSMDLIRIQYLPGACCVGGVLSHLNGKPRGRAAKSSTHEGLRAETTGLSQWLCEKCLSGSSSCRGERGLQRKVTSWPGGCACPMEMLEQIGRDEALGAGLCCPFKVSQPETQLCP